MPHQRPIQRTSPPTRPMVMQWARTHQTAAYGVRTVQNRTVVLPGKFPLASGTGRDYVCIALNLRVGESRSRLRCTYRRGCKPLRCGFGEPDPEADDRKFLQEHLSGRLQAV